MKHVYNKAVAASIKSNVKERKELREWQKKSRSEKKSNNMKRIDIDHER